jgi:hypothetical protein
MRVEIERLCAAFESSTRAIRTIDNPMATAAEKVSALGEAGSSLCKEFKNLANDVDFWDALEGNRPRERQQELASVLGKLNEKDNRTLEDIAEVLQRLGFRPSGEAHETLRGFVASLHAATLLPQQGSLPKSQTASSLRKHGHAAALSFQTAFCDGIKECVSKEKRRALRFAGEKYVLSESGKAGANLIRWGAGVVFAAILSHALPDFVPYLPDSARERVCEVAPQTPEILRPLVLNAFCTSPTALAIYPKRLVASKAGQDRLIEVNGVHTFRYVKHPPWIEIEGYQAKEEERQAAKVSLRLGL